MRRPRSAALLLASAPLVAGTARATYSIAAVDRERGELGGAATSCLRGQDVAIVYRSVPGVGAVLAQAHYARSTHAQAIEQLALGKSPSEVIAAVTAGPDPTPEVRQYAVLDFMGRLAHFTGEATDPFAGAVEGESGGLRFSVQGNLLTGRAVLDGAARALTAPACDLAERLMTALEAGAAGGQGDKRCTGSGIPADSAFLQVEAESGDVLVSLSVASSGDRDPLGELRAQLAAYRTQTPCAPAPPAAEKPERRTSGGGCSVGAPAPQHLGWLALLVAGVGARRRLRGAVLGTIGWCRSKTW